MKQVPMRRAVLCVILCVVFTALTTYQFSYYGAFARYRAELADLTEEMRIEREEAAMEREALTAAHEDTVAALKARADELATRLTALTGSETGTAEDCLRLLLRQSLLRRDGEVGSTSSDKIEEQVTQYMETHANNALAVAEQLLFIDYLYRNNYVGDTDGLTAEELTAALARAYIDAAGDVYAKYYTPEEYLRFRDKMQSRSSGIGTIITMGDDGSSIEILHVHTGSPAEKAGLMAGDLIRRINGRAVDTSTTEAYEAAAGKIGGEKGSEVTLTLERDGTPFEKTLTRDEVNADTVIYRMIGEIGYVRILNFTAGTAAQFAVACEELESAGATAFVFDVRDNGGGLLTAIIDVLDYILPAGTPLISYTYKNQNNQRVPCVAETEQALSLPIYVLTNRVTASAAELFCAVLGKNGATLVGETTYGKGTMQTGYLLENGAYITVSVALYAPGAGENYEGLGVLPDHTARPEAAYENVPIWKLPTDKDLALEKALELAAS